MDLILFHHIYQGVLFLAYREGAWLEDGEVNYKECETTRHYKKKVVDYICNVIRMEFSMTFYKKKVVDCNFIRREF